MNDAKTAKAFADLDKAEVRLIRAFNKYAKARAKVKRMDARYAKELAETLPGKADVTELAKAAGIKPKPWPKGSNKVIKVKLKTR